jgi:hypothetical protein
MTLWRATRNGDLKLVKKLLDEGADIHARDDGALYLASTYGHHEVVKLLLDRGANIHVMDNNTWYWASRNDHFEVMKLLLDRGATVGQWKICNKESQILLDNYLIWRKYWKLWRRSLIKKWARRLLQIWFSPNMPGGLAAKRSLYKI